MTRPSLRSRLRSRTEDSERGMLSMVMLVTIIGMSLGALLVPIVVSQSHSTTHTDSRVQALEQAQSGVDAALGLIRNAPSNGSTFSPSDKLPCGVPITGSATNNYSVTISYVTVAGANVLCSPALLGASLPATATITSTGQFSFGGSASVRKLVTTYTFVQSKELASPVGGQIRLDASGATVPLKCIDSSTSPLGVATCSSASATQQFIYASDLTLRLFNATASPHGMCLQANVVNSSVSVARCAATGAAPVTQQWRLSSTSVFLSVAAANAPVCLAVQGTSLYTPSASLAPCSTSSATVTWLPTPGAGAGAAGAPNNQLVNFSQFDKCAQAGSVGPGSSVALAACDQDTTVSLVPWKQQFSYDSSSQTFKTVDPSSGTSYCLTSSGAGQPVAVLICAPGAPTQQWTQPGDYTIRDNNNLCLALSNYSSVVTITCVGSSNPTYIQQVWNASSSSSSVIAEPNS